MDYPDWTRLFYLTGTSITIPISIEASDVTIPVSIDASSVTLNVSLFSLPFETTAENLLTNPGFETGDLTGWQLRVGASAAISHTIVWKGSYACAVVSNGGVESELVSTTHIPCYPGQRLLVSAAMRSLAALDASQLLVAYYSAEDVYLQTDYGPDYGGNYNWMPRVNTFVVPDGAAFAAVGVGFKGYGAGGIGHVDSFLAVRLVQPVLDSDLNLNINIVAQDIASLNINIAASAIAIDIVFTDQSVAVFDIIGWSARQGQSKLYHFTENIGSGVTAYVIILTVPAGKKFYLTHFWGSQEGRTKQYLYSITPAVDIFDGVVDIYSPLLLPLAPPIVLIAGQVLKVQVRNDAAFEITYRGTVGGYELPA